jgi:DNA-binding LytR/AlgR family response regulator
MKAMSMRVIIVEDEIHNVRLLQGMLKELRPNWEVVTTIESVRGCVEYLKSNPYPDLFFMDIQLSDGICFSIFDQVDITEQVIFTTAYDEYAIQAFQVNSVDYLLKPLKTESLKAAIEKFEELYSKLNQESFDYQELAKLIRSGKKEYRKRLVVAGATSYSKIEVEDVAFFFSESKITNAVTYDGTQHILNQTLEKLEGQLDPSLFFRANRSYILNVGAIRKFENYFGGKLIVKLVQPFKETITVSRLKAALFKEWLDS